MKLSSLHKGLIGSWNLDQQSYNPATKRFSDATPYENNGISANAANFGMDRMGQANRSTIFNGTSDYINCGNDESLNFEYNDSFTFSAWIKTNVATNWGAIFGKRVSGGNNEGIQVGTWSNGLPMLILKNSEDHILDMVSQQAIQQGQWTHIVWSYTGNSLSSGVKLYLDSESIDSTIRENTLGTNSILNSNDACIGSQNTGIHYFNGIIDEVRIYNRPLSQPEIIALYEQYRSKVIL